MLESISIHRGLLLQSGSLRLNRSVPPRGSGWVRASRDVYRLPTRYREVVLTCSIGHPNLGDNGLHIYVRFRVGKSQIGSRKSRMKLNYFNYFTEIEDAFVRRRAKHLFLSPMDWALMETWKEQGIPLHIILRGIEKSFDSYEAKPRKRSVKSLLYCQEEVEAQFAEWIESRVGASSSQDGDVQDGEIEAAKVPFSLTAIGDHLERGRLALTRAATTRRQNGEDDFSETLSRAAALLEEISIDFAAGLSPDARKLEDSLTGLERMLSDAVLSVVPAEQLDSIKNEVKEQLRSYRNQMEPEVYKQTFDNLLLKRLREQFTVPRLSLFYL